MPLFPGAWELAWNILERNWWVDLVSDLAPKGVQMALTKAKERFLNDDWSPANEALPSKQVSSLLPLKEFIQLNNESPH